MYSVLIQNQKTMESFYDFHPIFMDPLMHEKIGCCRWNEAGTSIDTALPGLCDLTADKEEWRAVIVRVEDESNMSMYNTVPNNAYDFLVNAEYDGGFGESSVPLVRLTHILGGVPAPELEFVEQLKEEENMAPRVVYSPLPSKERILQHRELVEKYEFDGKKPSDIVLITFHSSTMKNVKRETEKVWGEEREINSSDFWRRNKYPSTCRFIQYDYTKQGRVQKNADIFNFWMCVLLLSTNDIDPSSLQAYRLYRAHIDFDVNQIKETFEEKVAELIGSKKYLDDEIKREVERRLNEKSSSPIYQMDIPVSVNIPSHWEVGVDANEFGICPKSANSELNKWEGLKAGAEENVDAVFRRAERALDESAERMRNASSFEAITVTSLDKFQIQDINNDLDRIFDRILQTQNELSSSRDAKFEKAEEAAKDVRKCIQERISKNVAVECGLLILILVLFSCIPAVFFKWKYHVGTYETSLSIMFLFVLTFLLVQCITLFCQRQKLKKKIGIYNDRMADNVSTLVQDVGLFSDFVSNIVTYSRGKSLLKKLRYKKYKIKDTYDLLQKHVYAINLFMEKIEKWSEAFYFSIQLNLDEIRENVFDSDILPKVNLLYTFEEDKKYEVPLNDTGDMVESPFDFIKKFVIEREELFGDAGVDD